jgi:hypothetical protein
VDAEAILAAGSRPQEPYDLNGTKVQLRSLAFADYAPWLRGGEVVVTVESITKLLTRAIVDEDGERVFKDSDAKRLGEMQPQAIMGMFNKVMSLSSLTAEAQEEAAEAFGEAQDEEASTG